jgi:hypothetical protein
MTRSNHLRVLPPPTVALEQVEPAAGASAPDGCRPQRGGPGYPCGLPGRGRR